MKRLIKIFFNVLGFHISKKLTPAGNPNEDAFYIQRILIGSNSKNLVIFDVGAYIGSVALHYNQLFSKPNIYCFEPFHSSYTSMLENIKPHENIKAINRGLSNFSGVAQFQSNAYSLTNSLLKTDISASDYWPDGLLNTTQLVEVQVTTIDHFVKENKISKIDILKIDAQGAELNIIKGAEETLKKGLIKLIYTEIITIPTYEGQYELHDIVALIQSFNFKLFNFYNPSLTNEGRLRQVDAIFIRY